MNMLSRSVADDAAMFVHDDVLEVSAHQSSSVLTTNDTAREWGEIVDELLRIRDLHDDWDGDGSPAPAPALAHLALKLAIAFRNQGNTPPDRVHAGVNGTIFFEWFGEDYLEIEVASPTQATWRYLIKGSSEAAIVTKEWKLGR